MVLLQGADVQVFATNCTDSVNGCGSARDRGYARNVVVDRGATDRFFVEERFAAKRSIDDEVDLTALDVVHNMRAAFIDLVNRFDFNSRTAQHASGSSCRDDFETDFDKVCRYLRNEI